MEAYILLLLFFLGLPVAIYLVLTDADKSAAAQEQQQARDEQAQKKNRPGVSVTNIAAYAMLGAIFVFMCVLTVLTRRGHA